MVKNKFNIICCSYNNEEWAETHLESILEQTYDNYEVIYVNDASTDKTMEVVNKLVGNDKRFHIINNKVNVDSPTNYFKCSYEFMENKDDNEILVELCGDDWFATPTVLEQLNEVYNNTDCWLTYGGMRVWKGGEDIVLPNPQNGHYHPFVHKHALYRKDAWKAGHLHSFRWFLHKQFDYKKEAISRFDNEIFKHAVDLQLQFSVMEMCPPSKIVNLDFPTVVFNGREVEKPLKDGSYRHSQENIKYEIEVRNKKKFKRVSTKDELKGEKLPQVNVFYGNMELNNIPTKFSYCYNQEDGDFDLVFMGDESIVDYLEGRIQIKKNTPIIARPYEDRNYWISKWGEPKIFNLLLKHYDKFDLILTLDKILLDKLPNAKFYPANYVSQFNILPNSDNIPHKKSIHWDSYEIPEKETFKIHKKSKLVSCVSSNKSFLPGHITRLKFIESIKTNPKIDFFGRGINPIDSKFDVLKDYAFSIAIEMIRPGDMYHADKQIWVDDEYLWSEKINDCFLTGTVPIYYGCPIIGEFFNTDGILVFNTIEELHNILNNLSMEQYESMLPAIEDNLNRAKKYPLNNDDLYEQFFKELIKK